jgi:SET domain-containing protein
MTINSFYISGSKCTNQKIGKNQWFKQLEVFQRDKYNQGLRSTTVVPKGTFVYEYVGEIITDEIHRDRKLNIYSKDEYNYSIKFTENLIIDATSMGNIGRFVSHSNSPNCEIQKWIVDGLPRMCIFTLRSIKFGEELTYNHNLQVSEPQNQGENHKRKRIIGKKQQKSFDYPRNLIKMEELTQYEKDVVLKTSAFLLRNLRRIKTKKESKTKTHNQQKQHIDEQPLPQFYPQNYYHRNLINNDSSLKGNSNLSHKGKYSYS